MTEEVLNFIVYVIENQQSFKVYIGYTSNLEKRLARHNKVLPSKKSSFTSKNFGKWKLIYTERFSTRSKAFKREKELKSSQGRKYLLQFRKVKLDRSVS